MISANYSNNNQDGVAFNRKVHWTRVIHIAESTLENPIYGIPRLRPVYNRLMDIEKVTGVLVLYILFFGVVFEEKLEESL